MNSPCEKRAAGATVSRDSVVAAGGHMADVFISYSKKDRDVARGLADFLESCGYNVWWDYELVGGEKFRSRIKDEGLKRRRRS